MASKEEMRQVLTRVGDKGEAGGCGVDGVLPVLAEKEEEGHDQAHSSIG